MIARAGEGAEPPVSPNERVRLFNGKVLGGFHSWLVELLPLNKAATAPAGRRVKLTDGLRFSGGQL
jgi:hypothetical protein